MLFLRVLNAGPKGFTRGSGSPTGLDFGHTPKQELTYAEW